MYYDTVGGDPYGEICLFSFKSEKGAENQEESVQMLADNVDDCILIFLCEIGHSSPVLTRSHISVAGHKKKRSTLQAEAALARKYE